MTNKEQISGVIPDSCKGLRLDHALVQIFPNFSRARLQKWIRNGDVLVDGKLLRPKDAVAGGEKVALQVELIDEVFLEPENIDLDVVYEDSSILVINKPANLVVHPGAGNLSGTLANALLHFDSNLRSVPRVGIVHRLDKDTSGLMVVARQLKSHANLVEQLQQRTVSRKYIALVYGEVIAGGSVDAPIGRHPVNRKCMAVIASGKPAVTHYRIRQRFKSFTLLDIQLETGRTHQIRVHMDHINHPIVGDPVYRKKIKSTKNTNRISNVTFTRQALHATSLELLHPDNDKTCKWEAPLPADFQQLLTTMEKL